MHPRTQVHVVVAEHVLHRKMFGSNHETLQHLNTREAYVLCTEVCTCTTYVYHSVLCTEEYVHVLNVFTIHIPQSLTLFSIMQCEL